jgi:hypothetical protein
MTDMFPDLPDWSFEADEVSAGVYRALGRDRAGRSVEVIGLDPDELIEKCKQKALQLIDEIQPAGDSA